MADNTTAPDLDELLKVWHDYGLRSTWKDIAQTGGRAEVVASWLALTPEVGPLEALEVNQRMVDLLIGRRWYVMRDAREAGKTWSEIGAALGMSKQGAQDWYRRAIAAQEEHLGELHDDDRTRNAL
jgi:hypothetical protein